MRTTVLVGSVIDLYVVRTSVNLSIATERRIIFSSTVTFSHIVHIILNESRVVLTNFVSGAVQMRADSYICASSQSIKACCPG